MTTTPPHIVMMSDTLTQKDPRILKFGRFFHGEKWRVTSLGVNMTAQTAPPLPWTHIEIIPPAPYSDVTPSTQPGWIARALAAILAGIAWILAFIHTPLAGLFDKARARALRGQSVTGQLLYYMGLRVGVRLFPSIWPRLYWKSEVFYRHIYEALAQLDGVDIWVANDWNMLPIALRLQREKGGKILYDSHEFACDEFSGDAQFRKWKQPLIRALERDCIAHVDAVSSVSDGLCEALAVRYKLTTRPLCLRNVPAYQAFEFRPVGPHIKCLYQGVIAPGRGLHTLIESVPLWPAHYHLTLRGPLNHNNYAQTLYDQIDALGLNGRVKLVDPVDFDAMIPAAHASDIGVMLLPGNSTHNIYALPNKIFEYMMAGLALCVSDLPEMAKITYDFKTGTRLPALTAQAIANAMTALTPEEINAQKRAALNAAKTLNWEHEATHLMVLCQGLLSSQEQN